MGAREGHRPAVVRRWCVAVLGAVVALGMGACTSPGGGEPTAGCTDQSRSAGEPGDAEPLLILGSANLSPTVVYADGAVVIPTAQVADSGDAAGFLRAPMMMPGYDGEQPGGYEGGWLSECELAIVTDLADDLITDDVDFGSPQVTDMGSTDVTYEDRSYSIYAFSRVDPDEFGGLTGAQERAREDLAELWDVVEQSTEQTGERDIDRLFLTFYAALDDASAVDWPLATPISELSRSSCVSIDEPDQVEAMLERLEGGDDLLIDGEWRLAVVAAAPGLPDCEDQ